MIVHNNHEYRKITKIEYNGKLFQLFLDDYNKLAFLEINKSGQLIYPELLDVLYLAKNFEPRNNMFCALKNNKIKKYKFIPKVLYKGSLIALSIALLTGCATTEKNQPAQPEEVKTTAAFPTPPKEEYNPEIYKKITDSYLEYLSPADDEYDYNWKYDYEKNYEGTLVTDSSGYENIFGFSKPTEEELIEVLSSNENIDADTKDIIENFCHRWLEMWPDSDLSVLKYNLTSLVVKKVSTQKIIELTNSPSAVAAYSFDDNIIYLNQESNYYDKNSSDYITFIHELIHAARNTKFEENNKKISVNFYIDKNSEKYTDEGLVNLFAKKIQGETINVNTYQLQTNYFELITDAINYSGADYMNHSINYLKAEMDNYMSDEQYAYHILSIITIQGQLHYNNASAITDYENYEELYNYIIRLYCTKNFDNNTSMNEVEEGFDDFWSFIRGGMDKYDSYKGFRENNIHELYSNYVENNYSQTNTITR